MSAPASPLLTAKEAAAYLRVSRAFMTIHASEIGYSRLGRDLRFKLADLDAYVARNTSAPKPRRVADDAPAPRRPAHPLLSKMTGPNPLTGLPYEVYQ